jgi:hypothetical protein
MAVDYEAVIADLETKRAAFNASVDGAINGIRHVLNAIAGLPSGPGVTPHISSTAVVGGQQAALTPDAFFGLNLADAAIKYLQNVKKQQTTREIADALEAANYHHTSQNFVNTVNTALYRREKEDGDVVKIGRNWALAEWYPGRRRGPIAPKEHKVASLHPGEMIDPQVEGVTDGEKDA